MIVNFGQFSAYVSGAVLWWVDCSVPARKHVPSQPTHGISLASVCVSVGKKWSEILSRTPSQAGICTLQRGWRVTMDLPNWDAFARSSHPAAVCHHLWRQREVHIREEKREYLKNAFVLIQMADGRGWWLPNTATFPALGQWGQPGLREPYGALLKLTSTQLGTAGTSWLLHLQGWNWKLEMNQML